MRKHWKLLPRVLHYLRPYRRLGVGSCIMTLLGAIVALAAPWPLAFLVDSVLGGNDGKHHTIPGWVTGLVGEAKGHLIVFAALAGLTIALITGAVHTLTEFVNTKLSQRMVLDFRSDLFGNAARQSLAYHDSRRSGDFIALINYESSAVGNIATSLPNLAQNLLTLCGMAYIVVRLDVVLALLALLVVPFIYYATG